jgi:ABC-type cobalamin transport system ATPase subunit
MLHVVGPDGYGKSDIVNFAAKYALQGRVDLDGALYVDIAKKETKSGLI